MGQRSETTVRVPLCSIERRSALSALVFVRKNARDGRRDRRKSDIPRITCERTNRGPRGLTRVLDIIRSFPREGVTTLSRFDWRIGSLYSKWSGPLYKLSCFHEDGKGEWPFEEKRISPKIRVIDELIQLRSRCYARRCYNLALETEATIVTFLFALMIRKKKNGMKRASLRQKRDIYVVASIRVDSRFFRTDRIISVSCQQHATASTMSPTRLMFLR